MTMLWFGHVIDQPVNAAMMILAPSGLAPGAAFRIAFVTDGTIAGTSSNYNDYQTFVTNQAAGYTYNGAPVSWFPIVSTADMNAAANLTGNAPVYLNDGITLISNTTANLFSGSLMAPLNEDLAGNNQTTLHSNTWTGSNTDGTVTADHGMGTDLPTYGSITNKDGTWISSGTNTGNAIPQPIYGVSQVFFVIPEPSSIWMAIAGLGTAIAYSAVHLRRPGRAPQPNHPE
jgi:hypothetical protein